MDYKSLVKLSPQMLDWMAYQWQLLPSEFLLQLLELWRDCRFEPNLSTETLPEFNQALIHDHPWLLVDYMENASDQHLILDSFYDKAWSDFFWAIILVLSASRLKRNKYTYESAQLFVLASTHWLDPIVGLYYYSPIDLALELLSDERPEALDFTQLLLYSFVSESSTPTRKLSKYLVENVELSLNIWTTWLSMCMALDLQSDKAHHCFVLWRRIIFSSFVPSTGVTLFVQRQSFEKSTTAVRYMDLLSSSSFASHLKCQDIQSFAQSPLLKSFYQSRQLTEADLPSNLVALFWMTNLKDFLPSSMARTDLSSNIPTMKRFLRETRGSVPAISTPISKQVASRFLQNCVLERALNDLDNALHSAIFVAYILECPFEIFDALLKNLPSIVEYLDELDQFHALAILLVQLYRHSLEKTDVLGLDYHAFYNLLMNLNDLIDHEEFEALAAPLLYDGSIFKASRSETPELEQVFGGMACSSVVRPWMDALGKNIN
jgi:hypothetical protein